MKDTVFISICIPAYKNTVYLERLLQSISIQTFKDFEVVISDDSPDDSVYEFVRSFTLIKDLKYYKNITPLGTPENWNESIKHAGGNWIKLMHDDDWFASPDSLKTFAQGIQRNPAVTFVYSAYSNVYLARNQSVEVYHSRLMRWLMHKSPFTLAAKNIIGPPSVTLYNKNQITFDRNLKWLVDIDFYIRYLTEKRSAYISIPLVNIGISDVQVTAASSKVKEVEVPEHFMLFNKTGFACLRNILVFDTLWRLLRNFSISKIKQIRESGYHGPIPRVVLSIIKLQSTLPSVLLKTGFVSKTLMAMCYLYYRMRHRRLNKVLA